jgi:hypothetical protein
MNNYLEKRIFTRHPSQGSITLYSSIGTFKEIDAKLLNISEQGICFTTNKELVPGTTILFKAANDICVSADNHEDCQLRTISLVTVKWCRESLHEDQTIHTIGATYMAPE